MIGLGLSAANAATVGVIVSGVVPNGTNVYASLCSGTLDPQACQFKDRQAASGESVAFTFSDVPEGLWAVAAFQDLNGDGTLERTPLGLPLEPFALSNEAGRARRPSFQQAALAVDARGRQIRLRLHGLSRAARPQ